MPTALQYLRTFNNATIQGLSDEALQIAIDAAFLEIHRATFGGTADIAAANLAAHNLLIEVGSSGATSGGAGGQLAGPVLEKQLGDMRIKYGSPGGSSGSGGGEQVDPLNATIYGQRFRQYRDNVAVGFTTSARLVPE